MSSMPVPQHGPICIPFRNLAGEDRGYPGHPAIYGRYIVIDLTANNRASIDQWAERNPGQPRPDLGFGVCRHGFGLQANPKRGNMSEADAIEWAKALNASIPIGALEDHIQTRQRVEDTTRAVFGDCAQ